MKGGGGGGHAPTVQMPPGLQSTINDIGSVSNNNIRPLTGNAATLGNWASQLATGGQGTQVNNSEVPWADTFGTGQPGTSKAANDPFLNTEKSIWAQMQGYGTNLADTGQAQVKQGVSDFGTAEQQYQSLLTGSGLFASQQKTVDMAVAEQKKAIDEQLASEGLSSSTMGAQLKGEADLSGAALAGQLTQGNLGIAQQQENVALNEEGTGANLETAGVNQLQAVAAMNAEQQAQFWNEAMQGYGLAGQFMNQQLSAFGYQLQGEQIQANVNIAQAQIQAQMQAQQQQASSSGFGSLLGGLGSLLGGGGGGGGLLGGLGGAAGAAGGAAGGIGSAVGSAVSALGAAFCSVSREIWGDDPQWMLVRDWMLFKAPRWLRTFYARNGVAISRYIADKPILKLLIKKVLLIVTG